MCFSVVPAVVTFSVLSIVLFLLFSGAFVHLVNGYRLGESFCCYLFVQNVNVQEFLLSFAPACWSGVYIWRRSCTPISTLPAAYLLCVIVWSPPDDFCCARLVLLPACRLGWAYMGFLLPCCT